MNTTDPPVTVTQIEFAIRSIAKTAIENERYFGELDAVVGDGDLGESPARGFEAILGDLNTFDRSSGGAFLKKVGPESKTNRPRFGSGGRWRQTSLFRASSRQSGRVV